MALPQSFICLTRPLLGEEAFEHLTQALAQEPVVSLRLNEDKLSSTSLLSALRAAMQPVPWCKTGYYLTERLTFTFDPLFHAGAYYVQEASSMFLEQVLKIYLTSPVVMLDLCAAPGGKSTHARSLLPQGSLLVANEVIRNRSLVLAENLMKWGHPDVMVTNNDPSDFSALPAFFDLIVADVPCSGEGMFRKDPKAVEEWSVDNVAICWQRQRRIIADVWPSLKPGGILIYSTCTYNTQENEENIAWIMEELGAEALPVSTDADWGVTGSLCAGVDFPVYRFLPHKARGEGFFLAVLRKTGGEETAPSLSKKRNSNKRSAAKQAYPKAAEAWLQHPDTYQYEMRGQLLTAFPNIHAEKLAAMQGLHIVHAGISLGEVKGNAIVPHHALATNRALNPTQFPTVALTYEQAIAYLRKEAVQLDADAARGYVLLYYKDVPLGFAKNIGNRANNLYPNEWRIRSGYLPDELKCLEHIAD